MTNSTIEGGVKRRYLVNVLTYVVASSREEAAQVARRFFDTTVTEYQIEVCEDHGFETPAERIWTQSTVGDGPPYTVEGCEHCAGCGELAWECICEDTIPDGES